MFAESIPKRRRPVIAMMTSVVFHGLLVGAVFYRPAPTFVRHSSVRAGQRGSLITPMFLARQGSGDLEQHEHSHIASSDAVRYARKRSHAKHAIGRLVRGDEGKIATQLASGTAGSSTESASAGSPFGSLYEGSATGFEIKPALPVTGPQPQVYTPKLPRGFEGDVIVEVTIDEQGKVTNKILVRGLGNGLDEQAIAVLENWRFKPATRDGVAIPSKQDVYFHFVGTRS
jgi:TonB family protein